MTAEGCTESITCRLLVGLLETVATSSIIMVCLCACVHYMLWLPGVASWDNVVEYTTRQLLPMLLLHDSIDTLNGFSVIYHVLINV